MICIRTIWPDVWYLRGQWCWSGEAMLSTKYLMYWRSHWRPSHIKPWLYISNKDNNNIFRNKWHTETILHFTFKTYLKVEFLWNFFQNFLLAENVQINILWETKTFNDDKHKFQLLLKHCKSILYDSSHSKENTYV